MMMMLSIKRGFGMGDCSPSLVAIGAFIILRFTLRFALTVTFLDIFEDPWGLLILFPNSGVGCREMRYEHATIPFRSSGSTDCFFEFAVVDRFELTLWEALLFLVFRGLIVMHDSCSEMWEIIFGLLTA
jgi:hypothetical protein